MKILSAIQMQQIDRRAIDGLGIPGLTLMENAGRGVFESIIRNFGEQQGKRIAVVCGKGNNGGDGFVVARYLKEAGAQPEIYLIGQTAEVRGDAAENLAKAGRTHIRISEVTDPQALAIASDVKLIVDAIFGTGFQGEVRPPHSVIIDKINQAGLPVVAVDCPSGLDSSTGAVAGSTVRATLTVTFGWPKVGHVLHPGKGYCGRLEVADIGFPTGLDDDISTFLIERLLAKTLLPARRPDAHKGDYGKVFVLAGSTGYTGAAAMAAHSALLSGCGLVILGIPATLNPILEAKLTEVITKPLPDVRKRGCFALRGMGEIRQLIQWADAVAIGPGIGTHHETAELIVRLTSQIEKPAVIDADALNILARHKEALKNHRCPLVISPHPGEFSRLTDLPVETITNDRFNIALKFAAEYNLVLILKGAPAIVADPSGELYINYSGNEGMATAGSGDVLTGLVAGFLAAGLTPKQAAILATYLHGVAGDIAAAEIGPRGMVAGDIMARVPKALKCIEMPETAPPQPTSIPFVPIH